MSAALAAPAAALAAAPDAASAQSELSAWATAVQNVSRMAELAVSLDAKQVEHPPAMRRLTMAVGDAAKLGKQWRDELRGDLVRAIPGGVIAYGDRFETSGARILTLLDGAEGAGRAEADSLLRGLVADLGDRLARSREAESAMKRFMLALQENNREITQFNKEAAKEVNMNVDEIKRLADDIDNVLKNLHGDKFKLDLLIGPLDGRDPLEALTGASALLPVLAPVSITRSVVNIGIKIGELFGGSDPRREMRDRIADLNRRRAGLTEEQRRLVSMNAILKNIEPLIAYSETACSSSAKIVNFWAVLVEKQKSLSSYLDKASNTDFSFLCRTYVKTSMSAWGQLSVYAQHLAAT